MNSALQGLARIEPAGDFYAEYGERFLLSRRFQLIGALIFTVLLPALARFGIEGAGIPSHSLQNTAAGAALAVITGFYFYHKLTRFPGTLASSFVLPTFAASFGAMLLTFFFLRLDYSRYEFAVSFITTVIWFYGTCLFSRHLKPHRLAIVPGGTASSLKDIGGVEWLELKMPFRPLQKLHGIVADLRANLPEHWERFIADCALQDIPVFHVRQVRESLTGRVEIEHLSENTLGSLNPSPVYMKVKQVVDWLSALAVLIVLSPLFALIALIICLETPGFPIFRQRRVGYRGNIITVYKFRTMIQTRPEGWDERASAITREEDSRVTRFGRLLRKSRFDEFPQLINILRGEMSWIGPRPEAAVLSRWYESELPFYRYRHIVRPGITGWAQVQQGHVAGVDLVLKKTHYDFYYIKNFSAWLDLLIVFRTIKTMLTGFGAR